MKFHLVLDGYHAQAGIAHERGAFLTATTAAKIRNAALALAHTLGAPHFDDENIAASFHGGCAVEGMPRGLHSMTEDYGRALLSGVTKSSRLQPVEVILAPQVWTPRGWRQPASVDLDIQARIGAAQAGDWLVVLTPDRHHAPAVGAAVARGVEVVVIVCNDARQFYSRKLVAAVRPNRAYKLRFSGAISLEPVAA